MKIVVAVTDRETGTEIFFLFKSHDAAECFIMLIDEQYHLKWARIMRK